MAPQTDPAWCLTSSASSAGTGTRPTDPRTLYLKYTTVHWGTNSPKPFFIVEHKQCKSGGDGVVVEVPMNCVLATFTYIYSSSLTQYHATCTYFVILSPLGREEFKEEVWFHSEDPAQNSRRRSSTLKKFWEVSGKEFKWLRGRWAIEPDFSFLKKYIKGGCDSSCWQNFKTRRGFNRRNGYWDWLISVLCFSK